MQQCRTSAADRTIRFLTAVLAGLFLALAFPAPPVKALDEYDLGLSQTPQPMCDSQKPLSESELKISLSLMKEIMNLAGNLTPEEEEAIVKSRGFTSDRLNCVLGKFMAANDIFGWGSPPAYGMDLSDEEYKVCLKYADEGPALRKYLIESLNIQVDPD